MTQRTVQCTTVRKTLRTSPRAWACRRTWDAAVGQRWGRVLCDRRFTDNEFAKLCVARMSRARETEHLSFRPVPVWPFFSHTPSPPLLLSFPRPPSFPPVPPRHPTTPIESHRVLRLWIPSLEWGPHSPRKDGFALTHLRGRRTFPNSLVIDPFSSNRFIPREAPTNKVTSVGGIDREILEGNIWPKV